MRVFTIGHGTRPLAELVMCLSHAGVQTVVDVRRFPGSRRNPQFNRAALAAGVEAADVAYRHELDLGGRRSGEPGEERFSCLGAFRGYAARMGTPPWQRALERALAEPTPCFLCAETLPERCHRRLIAELLAARGHDVVHLIRPGEAARHRPARSAEVRDGRLYLCGEPVA
ncbi:MAG: DUF488 family protein [Gaiellaceae bacterium]